MAKKPEYVGLVYDFIEEVVIERSPIVRATAADALADAKALCRVVNAQAEAYDDTNDDNTTVGRVDASYAAVQGPHGIEDEDDIQNREYDEHADREELRAMGRLPGMDDTPSLSALPAA
jgi:hypothetical protein